MPDDAAPKLIEFLTADPTRWPAPFSAATALPQWLKDMPSEVPAPGAPADQSLLTVKRCPPFVEALTCGYLMPLPGRVTFSMDASGRLAFDADGRILDSQPAVQYAASPIGGATVVKFLNPWLIRTPPGYSTLIVQPLNRFEVPFHILAGVVETDSYYREVNFPAVCLLRPGQSVTMPAGTPIAQAIPFPREAWTSSSGQWDMAQRDAIEHEFAANPHMYKQQNWRRKSYE
jgi:hypothetical protein